VQRTYSSGFERSCCTTAPHTDYLHHKLCTAPSPGRL
jgi:hypothetical protein